MQAASLTGLFACQYWKNQYKRVRPAQLFPGLLPPIATPGHASFPSGHATQARLVFRCLLSVLPTAPFAGTGTGTASLARMFGFAGEQLAQRIARNREIAGLHYPSDSRGGQLLADKLFDNILKPAAAPSSSAMPVYKGLVAAAKKEWK
jgi:membrane-associated phospholipid phosphatase